MGLSSDGTYYAQNKDRIYSVVEAENGDGWIIGWKTYYGKTIRGTKSFGHFDTVEEAQAALDVLAVKNGWRYLAITEDTKGKRVYSWFTAGFDPLTENTGYDERVELSA